jgi:hypothetical protein
MDCDIYIWAHGGSWPGLRTRRGQRREELDSLRKWQRAAMASSVWKIVVRVENPYIWCERSIIMSGQWNITWWCV